MTPVQMDNGLTFLAEIPTRDDGARPLRLMVRRPDRMGYMWVQWDHDAQKYVEDSP